jgi:Helix-turn-helix domain
MERLTYTVSEVAKLLGISRSKAYDLVAAVCCQSFHCRAGASSSPERSSSASSTRPNRRPQA